MSFKTVADADSALALLREQHAALEAEEDVAAYAASHDRRAALLVEIAADESVRAKLLAKEQAAERAEDAAMLARLLAFVDSVDPTVEAHETRVVSIVRELAGIVLDIEAAAKERSKAATRVRAIARKLGSPHAAIDVQRSPWRAYNRIARAIGADARSRGPEGLRLADRVVALVTPNHGVNEFQPTLAQAESNAPCARVVPDPQVIIDDDGYELLHAASAGHILDVVAAAEAEA